MVQQGQRSAATCPWCQAPLEDKQYILWCPAQNAWLQWTKSLSKLRNWLREQGMEPHLRELLIEHLEGWATDTPTHTSQHNCTLLDDQSQIRWDHMLDSWLSQYWHVYQEQAWQQVFSRKLSARWMSALIQKLWGISWDMWEHCNNKLHGDSVVTQHITHSLIDEQITLLYTGGVQQFPRDALKFLSTPLDTVLNYILASKQLWVESIKAAQQWCQHHEFGKYLSK